jgi:hypothetical protein
MVGRMNYLTLPIDWRAYTRSHAVVAAVLEFAPEAFEVEESVQ